MPQLNLMIGWSGIVLGFISGMVLGLFFHGENWLGGYGSFRRRLYRLAHISFFGLGATNLLFCFTAQRFATANLAPSVASWGFVAGAVTMPLCCVVMAHHPKAQMLFAVPVVSLLAGGVLTLLEIIRL